MVRLEGGKSLLSGVKGQTEPDFCMQQNQSYQFTRIHNSTIIPGTLSFLANRLPETAGLVIKDDAVHELYRRRLDFPARIPLLLLHAGEECKSPQTVQCIYRFLSENNAARDSCVYVIGGGTITDAAAYAVSTFKRGCKLILVPTTLVGMIDAALGGKTGINLGYQKNAVGTFYPADEILIIPEFQDSLPESELQTGLAEMLKLWFIDKELSLPKLNMHKLITPEQLVEYAKAKLQTCSNDVEDKAERRLLNLGHTFGHILESISHYKLSHGRAVALGIAIALKLSCKLGYLDFEAAAEMEKTLIDFGLHTRADAEIAKLFLDKAGTLIRQDKKAGENGLPLILFKGYRQVFIDESVPLSSVLDLLPECI
jgi:3-dehydroquinate synthase